ncbi:hypothetical protein [Thermococcus sp.]|uniref:hypothetical protein n=1 Tax=Thermococcus sp. TaxID=35749 RepID=UPI00262E29FA|nr:hypothetical protein [Thermococcus sp.]
MVTVSVIGSKGEVSSKQGLIRVIDNLPPHVSLFQVTPIQGRVPLRVLIHIEAKDPDPLPGSGGISKTEFDMDGDGVPDIMKDGLAEQVSYTYNNPGVYRVVARVYDDQNAFTMAGPITISAFLPEPVIENPEREIWHGGGGMASSITWSVPGKLIIADGYEGIKLYKNFYPDDITLVRKDLSYMDAQVSQVKIFENRIFANMDNAMGVYSAPMTYNGGWGKFSSVIEGNWLPLKEFYYNGNGFLVTVNDSSTSVALIEVKDGEIKGVYSHSLEFYSDYLQRNGGPSECSYPAIRDVVPAKDHVIFVMKKCLWDLPAEAIIRDIENPGNLKYFVPSLSLSDELYKGLFLKDSIILYSTYGIEEAKYYPPQVTDFSSINIGTIVDWVPSAFFGIYSKTSTNVVLLQSSNSGNNYLYSFSSSDQTINYLRKMNMNFLVRDFKRDGKKKIFAVGKDGIIIEQNNDVYKFPINDHMEGFAIAKLNGGNLLITTQNRSGYEVLDIDHFTSPMFLYHGGSFLTQYKNIFVKGEYGWLVTMSDKVAWLNRIKVITQPPYIQFLGKRKIADLEKGENFGFYPLEDSDVVGIEHEGPQEIYSCLITSKNLNQECNKIASEANGMTRINDALFISNPAASVYYYSISALLDGENGYLGFENLNYNGDIITPLAIGALKWNKENILLIGGGNRKLYGYTYSEDNKTLFTRDGYPLFSNSSLYSSNLNFKRIKTLGPYAFLGLGEGGFAIVNAYNPGILSYERGLMVTDILFYPYSQNDDNVRIIVRSILSILNNIDYPDTIQFMEIPELKYPQ